MAKNKSTPTAAGGNKNVSVPSTPASGSMPALPLFYKKVVPLNRQRHKNIYVQTDRGFAFARATNSVYLAAVEFPAAALEYPIVFAAAGNGDIVPTALLGLRGNQNLHVDANGKWLGRYVPAYIRRYPFILASDTKQSQFTVCFDESFEGFNTAKKGEPLVTEKGEDSTLLKNSVEFLKDYQANIARTNEFCQILRGLNVLDAVQANIQMNSGEKFSLAGLTCVNREKLKALPVEQIQMLLKKDYLELIYLHMTSLVNIQSLISKLTATKK